MKSLVLVTARLIAIGVISFVGGWFAFQQLDPFLASKLYSETWWYWLPSSVELVVKVGVEFLAYSPVVVAPIWIYHRLTFRRFRDGSTYCGYCRGLLKGLEHPQCPGCGEAI